MKMGIRFSEVSAVKKQGLEPKLEPNLGSDCQSEPDPKPHFESGI